MSSFLIESLNIGNLRFLVFFSVLVYFLFTYFESRRIQDEREELIRLKSFEIMHKLIMMAATLCAVLLIFDPFVLGIYPVLVIVLMSLWGEVFAKIYLRRKY